MELRMCVRRHHTSCPPRALIDGMLPAAVEYLMVRAGTRYGGCWDRRRTWRFPPHLMPALYEN